MLAFLSLSTTQHIVIIRHVQVCASQQYQITRETKEQQCHHTTVDESSKLAFTQAFMARTMAEKEGKSVDKARKGKIKIFKRFSMNVKLCLKQDKSVI